MTVITSPRLGARIAPNKFVDAYRTAKSVLACRTRHFDISSQPHFDEAGIAYFREQLQRTRNYLEYGSGGSTVVANQRVQMLVSVDSDAHYLAAVRRKLVADATGIHESRRDATKLIYINIGFTVDWGIPACTRPTRRRIHRWENYPSAPWRYFRSIEQQPDLILVDGRFRVACVLESLLNLWPLDDTPILLDDYSTRPHYHVVERFADLEMVGRMAVLHPRRSWNRSEGRQLLEVYRLDYR